MSITQFNQIARQTAALHRTEHAAHHGAQGILHDFIIGNQAVGRSIGHALFGDALRGAGQAL